jgi:hypothetical protein
MNHTCDTVRSGSEKGNTCAACHRQPIRPSIPTGYGDLSAEFERLTARIGTKRATSPKPGR